MRGLSATLAFCIALATACDIASALDIPAGRLDAGPVLAGESVVWTKRAPARVLKLRSFRLGRGPATTIASFSANGLFQHAELSASSTAVAAQVFSGDGVGTPRVSIFAGPPTGPLDSIQSKCSATQADHRTIDASGRSVLFGTCGGRSATVRDLDSGDETQIPANPRALRLAGHFAAWAEGESGVDDQSVVVYDVAAGAVSYRIPNEALPRGAVDDLDLQDDGKIVVVYPIPQPVRFRVAWASPDEPTLHVIPLPPRQSYRVSLAGDRVAFDRVPAGDGPIVRSEVGVSDLAGHSRLLGIGGDDDTEAGLDFDGGRLAWFSYGCHQVILHVRSATASGVVKSAPRCPLTLKQQPIVRHGSTRLFVDCFGFAGEGCAADAIVMRVGKRVVGTGATFRKVRLNHLGRRLFARRHHRLAVEISARLEDSVGRVERRRGRAVLRSP